MKFISLFTGFGGLDMGLERAGMECVYQVEIKPYARRVLERYFPNTPRHEDITTLHEVPEAGVLVGGFPCQDISIAGTKRGLDGERSGLWREFKRVITLGNWKYILIENTTGLLIPRNGKPPVIETVLEDLSSCGYDAEWEVISSKSLGAPHERERVFIAAYPMREGLEGTRLPVFHTKPTRGEVWWFGLSESDTLRKTAGVPFYRDRIEGLGNMVDVRVAEWVGAQLMKHAGVLYDRSA